MNNYYKLYIEDIYNLAQTIVIKFEDAASAINLKVMTKHGIGAVDTEEPTTWKYYQNISGVYHFSDIADIGGYIKVVSLDTLDTIDFTIDSLKLHPVTSKAYLFDKRHYRELIQKYPDYELLILGVLYPCDIILAISAKDGTILSYPKYLIESNEYTLIEKLQTWIYKYVDRWINKQFTISDDLYAATYMGQLYLHLVPAIINIRLQACKTNEAHSFHVRQYLASHQMLDIYLDAMTKSQSLFFYRNIKYIERNAGNRDTFDWLVHNLMTVRNLPLYDYTLKHNVSNMLGSVYNNNTTDYYPEIFFRRNPINYRVIDSPNSFVSLEDVNYKLKYVYPGNSEYLHSNKTAIENTLKDSRSNVVGTKLLESIVTDYTDSVPYTLETILLNHWLYWSSNDIYRAYVTITIIKTKKTIDINALDAFILFIYCLNRSVGVTPTTIPDVLASRVLQYPKVNKTNLRKITDPDYVTSEQIDLIYSTVPTITGVSTIDSFYEQCRAIYLSTIQQDLIQSSTEHFYTRAQLQTAVTSLYADVKVNIRKNNSTYENWFNERGLEFNDYTNGDFSDLAVSITNSVTGTLNKTPMSIKTIQKSMIQIFEMLSSYSIEFISNITEPPLMLIARPAVRVGNILQIDKSLEHIDISQPTVEDVITTEETHFDFNIDRIFPIGIPITREIDVSSRVEIGVNTTLDISANKESPVLIHLPNIRINNVITIAPVDNAFLGKLNIVDIRFTGDPYAIKLKEYIGVTVDVPIKLFSDLTAFYQDIVTTVPINLFGMDGEVNIIIKPPLLVTENDSIYFASLEYTDDTYRVPVVVETAKNHFTTIVFSENIFRPPASNTVTRNYFTSESYNTDYNFRPPVTTVNVTNHYTSISYVGDDFIANTVNVDISLYSIPDSGNVKIDSPKAVTENSAVTFTSLQYDDYKFRPPLTTTVTVNYYTSVLFS